MRHSIAEGVEDRATMAMTSADWSDADVALLADVYDLECKSRMNVLY
jgi:hypothetical protein